MDSTFFLDFLGNEIRVGNTVVYPGRQGAHLWLNKGLVEELGHIKHWSGREIKRIKVRRISRGKREKEMSVWVEKLERVVVVA